MNYQDFLKNKIVSAPATGFDVDPDSLHPALFGFQRDIVHWALRKGRAALFEDCGLGKTLQQLDWARNVVARTGGNVLILAPLAVSAQTVAEGARFGIEVTSARSQDDVRPDVTVTNYEMLHRFSPESFAGVVLDESSILKSFDGKYRNMIVGGFSDTPYRLACTATPAPNDFMELGNHAEFLGVMTRTEMLAMFFTHDGGDTSHWRLRGHAEEDFWKWMASWAVMVRRPSDLGYPDDKFVLPELSHHHHAIIRPIEAAWDSGALFTVEAQTLQERQRERKASTNDRVAKCAELVNADADPWVVWCNLNDEADSIERAIPGAVQVAGSDKPEHKEWAMAAFTRGEIRVLVTKPSIAGWGMNWQHCARMAFVGLSDSWEQYYQAVRRCWRFGQNRPVECHVITADSEGAVVANIERKEADALRMAENMVTHMKELNAAELRGTQRNRTDYAPQTATGRGWTLRLGDCVDVARSMETGSVDYTIYSPPFASLYTYSNSERDMGNCKDDGEFYRHFEFLAGELLRVTKTGRLMSFHCMNLPMSKTRDGVIGLRDFRGQLIKMFESHGWIFHSEVCIWKDPVTAMQRTKALGLLYKQIKKDSAMSRQGIPDYLVTMRKPGENPDPVTHTPDELPCSLWQRYASPVWMDINPSRTLQRDNARDGRDERHICPLQLDVIERAIHLWSNPGDLVFSPFAGIASEGHVALQMGRRFEGAELKPSYFHVAAENLCRAETSAGSASLFDELMETAA